MEDKIIVLACTACWARMASVSAANASLQSYGGEFLFKSSYESCKD